MTNEEFDDLMFELGVNDMTDEEFADWLRENRDDGEYPDSSDLPDPMRGFADSLWDDIENGTSNVIGVARSGKGVLWGMRGPPENDIVLSRITADLVRYVDTRATYVMYTSYLSREARYDLETLENTGGLNWTTPRQSAFHIRRRGEHHAAGAVYSVRGRRLTKGLLDYVVQSYWANRPYAGDSIFYLAPLTDVGAWAPMRAGETNCFVNILRERYGDMDILSEFEAAHPDGVEVTDVSGLARSLKVNFVFHGIDMKEISTISCGYTKKGTLRMVRHNGHCWSADSFPEFPNMEQRTPGVFAWSTTPIGEAKRLLQPGEVGWKVGDELILEDGRVLRDMMLKSEIERVAAFEGASVEESLKEVGGVFSYRFRRWVAKNDLRKASKGLAEDLAASQVEAVLWNTAEPYDVEDCYELDMRAAYLGCEDPAYGRADSGCKEYLSWGMPNGGGGMKWYSAKTLSDVEGCKGSFVRFRSWSFEGPAYLGLFEKHLEEKGIMPTPLAVALRDLGFLVTHELSGVLVSFRAGRLLEFPVPGPGDRTPVSFVGMCAHKPNKSLLFTDPEEAKHYMNEYCKAGLNPRLTDHGGLFEFVSDSGEPPKYPHVRAYVLAYMHIATLVKLAEDPTAVRVSTDSLTYVGKKEATHTKVKYGVWRVKETPKPWKEFAVWGLTASGAAAEGPLYPPLPAPFHKSHLTYLDGQGGAGKTTLSIEAFSGASVVLLAKDWFGVEDIKGKVAKARQAGHNTDKMRVITYQSFWHVGFASEVCPPGCNGCLVCNGWDRSCMLKKGSPLKRGGLPKVIVWDEPGYVPEYILRPTLEYCRDMGTRVVACGDILGQVRQFRDRGDGDPAAHTALIDLGAELVFIDADRRSLCADLCKLKTSIWRKDERLQISDTVGALSEIGRVGHLKDAMAVWTPDAIVAVSKREEGSMLQPILLSQHEKRFPNALVPMRFAPPEHLRKEYRPTDTVSPPGYFLGGRGGRVKEVPAIVGTRVMVPIEEVKYYMASPVEKVWVYDGWRTVHLLQGHTIECPGEPEDHALFVWSASLGQRWNKNATYTAVSRVRHLRQLYWVFP